MSRDKKPLHKIRSSYEKGVLHKADLDADPFIQFQKWFDAAEHHHPVEINAMTLATVDSSGQPSARIVLLKEMESGGFVFYSNYGSRKARDLEDNQKAVLLFYWPVMEQQVRIEGLVEKIDAGASTAYFHTRPRGSQLGAWASPQSTVIASREELIRRVDELEEKYKNESVLPKPPFWGGYILQPHYFEFWQGRANRLHDRFAYRPLESGKPGWRIDRLAP